MQLLYDIRAEVWIADCQRTATIPTDILVRLKGRFNRPYNADVLQVETREADGQDPLTHSLHISREGLYDILPESLHHPQAPPVRAGRDEARAMLEQSKQLRREETEARRFWLPFDQESFRQRVDIENQEAQALTRSHGPIWDELQDYLWGALPVSLSSRQRACLLAVWMNAHRIMGNWEQTAFYFSEFLQTPVHIQHGSFLETNWTNNRHVDPIAGLGAGRLGQDWVLANRNVTDDGGTIRLSAGPLTDEQLQTYLLNGVALDYVRLLADYLLPADADWQLSIQTDAETGSDGFRLSTAGTTGRLGLTTTLAA